MTLQKVAFGFLDASFPPESACFESGYIAAIVASIALVARISNGPRGSALVITAIALANIGCLIVAGNFFAKHPAHSQPAKPGTDQLSLFSVSGGGSGEVLRISRSRHAMRGCGLVRVPVDAGSDHAPGHAVDRLAVNRIVHLRLAILDSVRAVFISGGGLGLGRVAVCGTPVSALDSGHFADRTVKQACGGGARFLNRLKVSFVSALCGCAQGDHVQILHGTAGGYLLMPVMEGY